MRRRHFLSLSASMAAFWPRIARADRARRIGFLRLGAPPESNIAAFEEGLRALGYRVGNDLIIEQRVTDEADALPALAGELVRSGVDVIVASSTLSALAAKRATSTIPIVFVAVSDPVQAGVVAGLARPGGNATGLSFVTADLTGKRLQNPARDPSAASPSSRKRDIRPRRRSSMARKPRRRRKACGSSC